MTSPLPEPRGSALTPLLNYLNIPHTPLNPTRAYTLSDVSDNLRSHSSTSLRCHLPKASHRERLRYITTLKGGEFLLVGYKDKHVIVGLQQNTSAGMVLHVAGDVVPLGDGVFRGRHPLEDLFDTVTLVYFVCAKFEDGHLVLPFLYRRRKVRQLRKIIQKRERLKKEADGSGKGRKMEKKKKKEKKRRTNES